MIEAVPTVIDQDTTLTGIVEGGELIEVHGAIEGDLSATHVIVHHGGRVIGNIRATTAHVHGTMQGEAFIKQLIDIGATGSVAGKIEYGQLALAAGGELEASMHNVPPTLGGDLDLSVKQGKSVLITTKDLNAIDPDDNASNLTFRISNAANGWVALSNDTSKPIQSFTQSDLQASRISFVHDGAAATTAGFSVLVADSQGATSGLPANVQITVQPSA